MCPIERGWSSRAIIRESEEPVQMAIDALSHLGARSSFATALPLQAPISPRQGLTERVKLPPPSLPFVP